MSIAKIGQPGYAQVAAPRPRVLAEHGHRRRAAALAVPDGAHQPAAPGEDDALLAQPLRDRLHEDRGHRSARPRRRATWRRRPSEDPGGVRGQIEMLRDNALGNFRRHSWSNIAKDTAMLFWLDGRTNTRREPQENFGREIMELFTMGVGHYTEADVYAAARVFTGWNLTRPGGDRRRQHYEFVYNASQHDTAREDVQLSDLPGRQQDHSGARGGERDAGRPRFHRGAGAQPEHGDAISRRSCTGSSSRSSATSTRGSSTASRRRTCQSGYDMKAVMREVLLSPRVLGRANRYFARYSWPVEFVVRVDEGRRLDRLLAERRAGAARRTWGRTCSIRRTSPAGISGQSWFSTGAMLARMNFASALAGNQKFKLARRPPSRTRRRRRSCSRACSTRSGRRRFDRPSRRARRLPACDRRLDRQRRRSCRTRWPASFTSSPGTPEYQFV